MPRTTANQVLTSGSKRATKGQHLWRRIFILNKTEMKEFHMQDYWLMCPAREWLQINVSTYGKL